MTTTFENKEAPSIAPEAPATTDPFKSRPWRECILFHAKPLFKIRRGYCQQARITAACWSKVGDRGIGAETAERAVAGIARAPNKMLVACMGPLQRLSHQVKASLPSGGDAFTSPA